MEKFRLIFELSEFDSATSTCNVLFESLDQRKYSESSCFEIWDKVIFTRWANGICGIIPQAISMHPTAAIFCMRIAIDNFAVKRI